MTTTILSMSLVALIAAILLIRRFWLLAKIEEYSLSALYFCHKTKTSVVIADEMFQLWSTTHMLFEVWRWNFSRYIVHQDHLEDMNAFIAIELERDDLDLAEFKGEEVDKKSDNEPTPLP